MLKIRTGSIFVGIAVLALMLVGCGAAATSTPVPTKAPAQPQAPAPAATVAPGPAPTAVVPGAPAPAATTAPAFAPTPISVTATPATVVAAKPEGTLVIINPSLKGLPVAGLPFNGPGGVRRDIVHYTFDTPLWATPDGTWYNRLAESWTIAADGSNITIFMKKGVQFHDGWGEVTAADLQWSLENAAAPGSGHIRSSAYRLIKGFQQPDPYTLVIETNPKNVLQMQGSFGPYRGIGVVSTKYIAAVGEDEAAQEWVGSGPWRHLTTRPGDLMTFEAVENHHFRTPAFKELTVRAISEPAAQLATIRTGEADMSNLPVNFLGEALLAGLNVIEAGEGGGQVRIKLGGQYLPDRGESDAGCSGEGGEAGFTDNCGHFDTDAAPWIGDINDPADWENARKVREAMTLAVDKQEIWLTIYGGIGRVATLETNTPDFNPVLFPPYEFNPTRARQFLAEAGWADGFEFDLVFEVEDFAEDLVAQAVQAMFADVGIKMKLKAGVDARPASVDRTFGSVKAEADLGRGSSAYSEIFGWWQGKSHSNTDNLSTSELRLLDQLSDDASTTLDFAARTKLNVEIQQILYDNFFSLPIVYLPILVVTGPRVDDYPFPFGGRTLPGISFATKAE